MKKYLTLILLLAAAAFLSAANTSPIRMTAAIDSGFDKPYGAAWWLHRAQSAKGSKVIIAREGANKYLQVAIPAGKKNANIVCDVPFLPLQGGKILITARIKGKGSLAFNFYTYESSGKYVGIYGTGKLIKVNSAKWQTYNDSVLFSKFPKRVGQLRLVIVAANSAKLSIDDVKLVAVKNQK